MGIQASSDDTSMTIVGGNPTGATIDTHNDHRMAMSFAIAALGASGASTIQHADVVDKSNPKFFQTLLALGADVKEAV